MYLRLRVCFGFGEKEDRGLVLNVFILGYKKGKFIYTFVSCVYRLGWVWAGGGFVLSVSDFFYESRRMMWLFVQKILP